MPIYNGKILTKVKAKTSGKNKKEVNGFYIDTDGNEFFIKQPNDTEKKELFTELFAGLFLTELKKREVFDPRYNDSLICADIIQLDDGSYALIQPKISAFKELCDVIGTKKKNGDGRDVFYEMVFASSCYPLLTQLGHYFGLSFSVMCSLWLSANSVHSDNIIVRDTDLQVEGQPDKKLVQFARLDWGDAFRDFAHAQNQNMLNPYEYNKSLINYKKFSKNYISNYRNVYGLYNSMSAHAGKLTEILSRQDIKEIVLSALSKIPADLLDQVLKKELAEYMAIPEFENVSFDEEVNYQAVADRFTKVLFDRLTSLAAIKDANVENKSFYQSYNGNNQNKDLIVDDNNNFSEQLDLWRELVNQRWRQGNLNYRKLDIDLLYQQFNSYVNSLAEQAEMFNFWEHADNSNQNIIVPYRDNQNDEEVQMGRAFLPQYRESVILRGLYSVYSEKGTVRIAPYDIPNARYRREMPNTSWDKICKVLDDGLNVIDTLRQLKESQGPKKAEYDSLGTTPIINDNIRLFLNNFAESQKDLNQHIRTLNKNNSARLDFESEFFYPISDDELQQMNGKQLITLCFEEMNSENPGNVIARIIKNSTLAERITSAYTKEDFGGRVDNPAQKFELIQSWYLLATKFQAVKFAFEAESSYEQKNALLQSLESLFVDLPDCLKIEEKQTIDNAKLKVQEWETYLYQLNEKDINYISVHTTEEKINSYNQFVTVFEKLPEGMNIAGLHEKNHLYRSEITYRQLLDLFNNARDVDNKTSAFELLMQAFSNFDQSQQEKYGDSFKIAGKEMLLLNNFLHALNKFNTAYGQEKIAANNGVQEEFQALMPNLQAIYKIEVDNCANEAKLLWLNRQSRLNHFEITALAFDNAEELPEKNAAFANLFDAYAQLPGELKDDAKKEYLRLCKNELHYLEAHRNFATSQTYDGKQEAFEKLNKAFEAMTQTQQNKHYASFSVFQEESINLQISNGNYLVAKHAFESAENDQAKLQQFQLLQNAFAALPLDLPQRYQNDQIACGNEHVFLQRMIACVEEANDEVKLNAFPLLAEAYLTLSPHLHNKYSGRYLDCNNESEFLIVINGLEELQSLSEWQNCFSGAVLPAFNRMSADNRQFYTARLNALQERNQKYNLLNENDLVDLDSPGAAINRALLAIENLNAAELLPTMDKAIWDTIFNAANREANPKAALTQVELDDLFILKQFCDTKLLENVDNDKDYKDSINRFYRQALAERLSTKTPKAQLDGIKAIAHQEFKHLGYEKSLRLCADVVMVASILFAGLGVLIMAGRYFCNDAVFFSNVRTKREISLTNDWVRQDLGEEDIAPDEHLLAAPAA